MRPLPAKTSTGEPIVIGSFHEDIDKIIPISIDRPHFGQSFTSVVTLEAQTALTLLTADEAPEQAAAPDLANGDPGAQPSNDRLGFDPQTHEENPVVVALPVALPIPVGVSIPVGQSVIGVFPEASIPYRPLRVWIAAHKFVNQRNNGISVTEGGPLFKAKSFDPSPFAGVTLVKNVTASTLTMLPPTDPLYTRVERVMLGEQKQAWLSIAETSTVVAVPVPAPAATNVNIAPST